MRTARFAAALGACLALLVPLLARAQGEITVTHLGATYIFGQQITFTLKAESSAGVSQATLFVETGAGDRVTVTEAEVTPGQQVEAAVVRDLQQQRVRPFSTLDYWWVVADESGAELETDHQSLYYEDNRFDWQSMARGPVVAHWYSGDLGFGQAAADAGALALPTISSDLGAEPPERVDVYVYATVTELQTGLALGGRTWVGGHADPDLGVVLIAVPPGPEAVLAFERDLPHELTHVLIYQVTEPNYASVPFWLNEGLAVLHETQPNPAYRVALDRAFEQDALLPISSLCGAFPLDASEATLAYAESLSVVTYIRDRWGSAQLVELLQAYADGATCEGGTQRVLRTSLAGLENDWSRDVLRGNPVLTAAARFGPWLLLLCVPALALFFLLLIPRRPLVQ